DTRPLGRNLALPAAALTRRPVSRETLQRLPGVRMSDLQAAVLGFVQGLTEWLPISSTAHLRIIPALLGWGDPGAAFTAIIQWGTFFAALVYFRRDIVAILTGRHADRETEEQ